MTPAPITAVILAGGASRRMGGRPKAFLHLAGGPLLHHVLTRLQGQVTRVLLNAPNEPPYHIPALPLIPDRRPGRLGPLAGIEAAFLATDAQWLLSVPVDTPFLPLDLAQRLFAHPVKPVAAMSQGRLHPTVALWPRSCLPRIATALDQGDLRLTDWFASPETAVDFSTRGGAPDPFFNINSPEDLVSAEQWLSS